jgi:hypothetical protein
MLQGLFEKFLPQSDEFLKKKKANANAVAFYGVGGTPCQIIA